MKLVYRKKNWKAIRKGISVMLLLGLFTLGAVGDSWNGISVKANGAAVHCKVMPLGDSITTGKYSGTNTSLGADSDDIGYRKDLHDLLELAGFSIDFVGTISNGSSYPFSDPQHEGHNGWRDDQIAANIYNNGGENWLSQNPADVILLHIGTNSLTSDETQVEDILDEIDEFEGQAGSKVIVIVARIIDQVPNEPTVNNFNNNVEGMVTGRTDYGTELFMVDMEDGAGLNYSIWPGVSTGDMIDPLHPYATGYTKMANTWFTRYNEVIGSALSNNAPIVSNPGSKKNAEDDNVSLQISASDSDGDNENYAAYNLPPGLNINSSGLITGTISKSASNGSPYSVRVIVSDGKTCGNASISFTWTIDEVNDPPVIVQPDDQINYSGESVSIQIVASDPDGDTLYYSTTGLPEGLIINQNGLITGTINQSAPGNSPYLVEVTVQEDGNSLSKDSKSFLWSIFEGAPTVVNPGNQLNKMGENISLTIDAISPKGSKLSFIAHNLPPNLTINKSSGEISGEIAEWAYLINPYEVGIFVTDDSEPPFSVEVNFIWMVHKGEIYIPVMIH